jgi:hypothetical protein
MTDDADGSGSTPPSSSVLPASATDRSASSDGGRFQDLDIDIETFLDFVLETAGWEVQMANLHPVEFHAVFVCGSWARGTATPYESDLDIRIVAEGVTDPFVAEQIGETIRSEIDPELVPEKVTSIDANVFADRPMESEARIQIYPPDGQL